MLLVGQVLVDVSRPLDPAGGLRLGGVVHAARMAWALGIEFSVAYIAPSYIVELTDKYLDSLGCSRHCQLGEVVGSPNVILIPEPTEAGTQGYDLLLDNDRSVVVDDDIAKEAFRSKWSAALVFPDRTDVEAISIHLPTDRIEAVYVDSALPLDQIDRFGGGTFITSASQDRCANGDPPSIASAALAAGFSAAIVKENRGGTRLWRGGSITQAGATLGPVVHSVGVGDAFDVAFAAMVDARGDQLALNAASQLAWAYASTTNPATFQRLVRSILSNPTDDNDSGQVTLSWEDRPAIEIYLAAPDFDWVDTTLLDNVEQALRYHNFSPTRPIAANGQVEPRRDSAAHLRTTFAADMELLERCDIVIAVLLHDDPGTIAELGWAAGRGKRVVLYDPMHRAENLMLTHLPDDVVRTANELTAAVYRNASAL
jgi:nucleoside 2-deoxyribosyltransferase